MGWLIFMGVVFVLFFLFIVGLSVVMTGAKIQQEQLRKQQDQERKGG